MIDNSASNKRIAKNTVFLTIRMVVVLGISLYSTRIVLRVLGVEDYGVYNVVCGFVSMFAFLNTSMSNGIQRFYNFEFGKNGETGANKVYCTSVLIQAILAIIIITLTESLGLWYLHHKMVIPEGRMLAAEWIFQFSVLSFVFIIMQAPYTAAVIAHERMDFYALVSVFDAMLKLGIVLVLPLFSKDKLVIYGLLFSLISVFNYCAYFVYCKKHFDEIKLRNFFDGTLFKSMLCFSGWNLFGSFSGIMKEQGINLILNFFYGPIVNAARGVAAQVKGGLESFVQNITMPVRPQVMQSYATGNIERTLKLTFSISKLSCFFFYFISLPIIIEINFILELWLGNDVPSHTPCFIIIIMTDTMVAYLNAAVSSVVHASGKMKRYQLTNGLIGIASVPIAFIALKCGAAPEWALIVTLISKAIAQVFSVVILKSIVCFSIKQYIKDVIWPIILVIIATAAFPFLPHFLMGESIIRLLAVVTIDLIVTILGIYFLGLNNAERELVGLLCGKMLGESRKNKNRNE